MARYRVLFADATSVDDEDKQDRDEPLTEGSEAHLKEIIASRFFFPPSDVAIEKWDGAWIDFTVWFSFEANSPMELRSETERIAETCGRDVEVFSVLDEKDNVVLTEEELWP